MHILMVAAENGALPGGKVGGIADVIRDLPRALARNGDRVTVITPGYQALSRLPGAEKINSLSVVLGEQLHEVFLYCLPESDKHPGITQYLLDCTAFAPCGAGHVYCHDRDEPFAVDASKFALFCQSVSLALVSGVIEKPDVIHLHDWHAALLLYLRQFIPACSPLKDIPCVYTIHNLSIQGVRPLQDNPSSLESWFGPLPEGLDKIRDPGYPDCVNMMRMGVNLSDKVHVVSPTYAREILQASDYAHGFIGGEGLEKDLIEARKSKRMFGILNGCDYEHEKVPPTGKKQVIRHAREAILGWVNGRMQIESAHFHSFQRLQDWQNDHTHDDFIVVSVGRLSGQKCRLLQENYRAKKTALDGILDYLNENKGLLLMLGSGDPKYEHFMCQAMLEHSNFIFLNGYSEGLADLFYRAGHLFLMPSSFEPCGISQLLAMRAGMPCLVHRTGGLSDTVSNGKNGFSFGGRTPRTQARNLVKTLRDAHSLFVHKREQWDAIVSEAGASRFTWEKVVKNYHRQLYSFKK